MPAPVYSWRFHNHSVGGQTWVYTVPPKKRAVVRFVSMTNYHTPPASGGLSINGVPVWLVLFQDQGNTRMAEVRGVAYEGDEVQLYLGSAEMYGHVTGFLFDDPVGSPTQPGQLPTDPIPGFPEPPLPAAPKWPAGSPPS